MDSPDEWWAKQSPTRKAQVQSWLDPELAGRPHPQVAGQIPLMHIDQPKEPTT